MSDEGEYTLKHPFWIDTEAYTDRDRDMFTCGVEFGQLLRDLEAGELTDRIIHAENESRIRMTLAKHGYRFEITDAGDLARAWSSLKIIDHT